MRLQIGGPVRYQTVCSSMGFVECVIGKRKQNIPQGLNCALRVPVRNHAIVESLILFIQLSFLLLTHRAAQQIRFTQRITCTLLGDRHHLLLIHNQAIGSIKNLGKRLFKLGVNRLNLLLTVLTKSIVRMRVRTHRSRAVQGKHSGNMLELFGLHEFKQAAHRTAIELEYA